MSRNSVSVSSVAVGTVSTNGIVVLSSRLLLDGRIDEEGRTQMLEEVFVPLEPEIAIDEDALAVFSLVTFVVTLLKKYRS
jgi:hypothetical protein